MYNFTLFEVSLIKLRRFNLKINLNFETPQQSVVANNWTSKQSAVDIVAYVLKLCKFDYTKCKALHSLSRAFTQLNDNEHSLGSQRFNTIDWGNKRWQLVFFPLFGCHRLRKSKYPLFKAVRVCGKPFAAEFRLEKQGKGKLLFCCLHPGR